jgi:hypothetical protein
MAGDFSRSSFDPARHNSGVRMQQGRVQLDADWNEQVDIATYYPRAAAADLIGPYGAPSDNAGFAISPKANDLTIGVGRMYVNGILCENAESISISAQPGLPGYVLPIVPATYTIYLDVWEREITALEDPGILEIALGGIDTTTRTRIVWQVKCSPYLGSCTPNFAAALPQSTGRMMAQAQPNAGALTPCAVPAQAGYTSLENQLYRIEVHTPGTASTATFKWSRDNGSVVAGWISQYGNQIVVSTLGKDQALGFASGQWVELTDDTHELNGLPGTLVQLSGAQMVGRSPTLSLGTVQGAGSTALASFPANPKVRRWDMPSGAMLLQEGAWITLENGVQVQFAAGGTYRTGDFWLVPARTATAMSSPTLVWPTGTNSSPSLQPAQGIAHAYAPLATAAYSTVSGWSVTADCRLIFEPVTTKSSGLHVIDMRTLQPAAELINDTLIPLTTFLNGFKITCDGAIDPATIKLPTFRATLDLPIYDSDTPSTGLYPAAAPTRLLASLAVGDAGDVSAFWIPTPQARSFVLNQMATFAAETFNHGQALVAVTLKGNFIWALGNAAKYLNGPAVGMPAQTGVTLALPSGNGQRGGDFESWFWVPGYTDSSFPPAYIPFFASSEVLGPDATGDYLFVGSMSYVSLLEMQALAEPDVTARKIYSNPIQIEPGIFAWAYVPTPAERTGNFSSFGIPIINPANGQSFPGNVIPPASQPRIVTGNQAPQPTAGIFAWRLRALQAVVGPYGYLHATYSYGGSGVGAELV